MGLMSTVHDPTGHLMDKPEEMIFFEALENETHNVQQVENNSMEQLDISSEFVALRPANPPQNVPMPAPPVPPRRVKRKQRFAPLHLINRTVFLPVLATNEMVQHFLSFTPIFPKFEFIKLPNLIRSEPMAIDIPPQQKTNNEMEQEDLIVEQIPVSKPKNFGVVKTMENSPKPNQNRSNDVGKIPKRNEFPIEIEFEAPEEIPPSNVLTPNENVDRISLPNPAQSTVADFSNNSLQVVRDAGTSKMQMSFPSIAGSSMDTVVHQLPPSVELPDVSSGIEVADHEYFIDELC